MNPRKGIGGLGFQARTGWAPPNHLQSSPLIHHAHQEVLLHLQQGSSSDTSHSSAIFSEDNRQGKDTASQRPAVHSQFHYSISEGSLNNYNGKTPVLLPSELSSRKTPCWYCFSVQNRGLPCHQQHNKHRESGPLRRRNSRVHSWRPASSATVCSGNKAAFTSPQRGVRLNTSAIKAQLKSIDCREKKHSANKLGFTVWRIEFHVLHACSQKKWLVFPKTVF